MKNVVNVKLFADNDHLNLQAEINYWLKRKRPRIIKWLFAVDGSEFTYAVMVVYR